jgi:hypothetical protein
MYAGFESNGWTYYRQAYACRSPVPLRLPQARSYAPLKGRSAVAQFCLFRVASQVLLRPHWLRRFFVRNWFENADFIYWENRVSPRLRRFPVAQSWWAMPALY